jgi:hypothetical protein
MYLKSRKNQIGDDYQKVESRTSCNALSKLFKKDIEVGEEGFEKI